MDAYSYMEMKQKYWLKLADNLFISENDREYFKTCIRDYFYRSDFDESKNFEVDSDIVEVFENNVAFDKLALPGVKTCPFCVAYYTDCTRCPYYHKYGCGNGSRYDRLHECIFDLRGVEEKNIAAGVVKYELKFH